MCWLCWFSDEFCGEEREALVGEDEREETVDEEEREVSDKGKFV